MNTRALIGPACMLWILQSTAVSAEEPARDHVHHTELGMNLGVMIWNDVDRDIVRPGATLSARLGYDLEYVVPQLEFGLRWSGVDLESLNATLGRNTLRSIFFALGARFQVPNKSRITPYADALFDMNWWNFRETTIACGVWYCDSVNTYRFSPGFRGRLGMLIGVAKLVDIEVGFGAGFSFQGDFFARNRSWLEPFVGFTYSFRSPEAYSLRP